MSWINHLPPACWSTFWKSNFKQQLGYRFDIMDNESYFFVFWHMQLYMSWYIRSFFGFTFLYILYFFKYSCTNIFHRRSLYTFYINWMLPKLFLHMFTPISDIHNYDTRQAINKNLFVSFKTTFRGQQSITYIGPHVWNFISSKINPHCCIGSFKRHIRQLLQHYFVSDDLTWWLLTLK